MKNNYQIVTLREQVKGFIKSKIFNGDLKPGEKINEIELAKELGTSRGPIREALRQIEQEGLVTYEPNKGCTVTKMTIREMYETSLIRADLEILAVRLCKGQYLDETIKKMEESAERIEKYDKQTTLGQVIEEDQNFHELIVKEAGLPHLLKLWHALDGTNITVYSTLYSGDMLCWGRIGINHRTILDSIKKKDVELITNDLQYHYGDVSQFINKFL